MNRTKSEHGDGSTNDFATASRSKSLKWAGMVLSITALVVVAAFFQHTKNTNRGYDMAYAQNMDQPTARPPMDAVSPEHIETASFGLG